MKTNAYDYIKAEFDKKAKLAREAGIRIEKGGLGVAVTRRMTISRYKT